MKKLIQPILAAAALFLAASGCASRAHLPGALAPMLWPPAPEAPRIHLVGEFAGPEDLGLARGPIGRVIDWIAEPSENRLVRPYAVAVAGTAQGTGPGDTAAPGPAVIAVSDTGAKVVHLFDLEHRAHRVVSEVGDVRRLTSPVGVAFDAQRRLYVCDSVLAAVVRYQADGAFDRVISEGFARPAGIMRGDNSTFLALLCPAGGSFNGTVSVELTDRLASRNWVKAA